MAPASPQDASSPAFGLPELPSKAVAPAGLTCGTSSSVPRPFLKWAGGKRQLLSTLLKAIEPVKWIRRYHEPFLGG